MLANLRGMTVAWVLCLIIGSAPMAVARAAPAANAVLRAGVARVDITPPAGVPLGGYGARKGKPATGVHDPLYAKALVLDSGAERIAICTVDMVLMPSSLYDDVAKQVAAQTKIPKDHLMICASHSHAGFGAVFKETRFITGAFDASLYRTVVDKLASAIVEAERKLAPARYGSGLTRVETLSRNRTRDGGPIDPDLHVLRIDRANGEPLAALMNFAAHPTVLGASTMEFSADFVGYATAAMEKTAPGLLALYANGTQGNVAPNPPKGEGGGFAACERMGKALADEALSVFLGIGTTDRVPIKVAFQPVKVRLTPHIDIDTYAQQFAIDQDVIVAIPGEAFVELGQAIKAKGRELGFRHVMTFGLANGSIGYMLPRDLWMKHEYESLVSAAGIGLGPFVRDTEIALMEALRAAIDWLPKGDGVIVPGRILPAGPVGGAVVQAVAGNGVGAGAAAIEITPVVSEDRPPVWIAGYGTGRRATGVHDDLYARAFALRAGGVTVAFVALDLVGLFYDDVLAIRAQLADVKLDHLVVASTHNHEGPDTMGQWGPSRGKTGRNPAYDAQVRERAAAAVRHAVAVLQPARIIFGQAEARGLMADTRLPTVLDETVYVMKAETLAGLTIGTLVNWSAHPETLGSKNTLITADFPYYVVRRMEQVLGGTAVYFSGSIGGLLTTERAVVTDPLTGQPAPEHSFRKAEVIGMQVAEAAVAAVKDQPASPIPTIRIQKKEVFVPMTNRLFRLASGLRLFGKRTLYSNGQPDETTEPGEKWGVPFSVPLGRDLLTEVNVITAGEAQFITVPGEIYPELVNGGIQSPQDPGADFPGAAREEPPLRSLMKGRYKFVLGLANDELGYIIPKSQWDEKPPFGYGRESAQYGESNSCGPDAAPAITGALRALLGR